MIKEYEYTLKFKEHEFQATFGNGACGACPFPSIHPIHKPKKSDTKYVYKNPNASWNLPK